jgi:hypothetical protein
LQPFCHAETSLTDDSQNSLDEQQAPERELDSLLLAGSNQEPRVSGANRV